MVLDWKEVNVNLNRNKINLPKSVTIKFQDKFKIRCIVKRKPLLFHIMLKQGLTWFTFGSQQPFRLQYKTSQIFFQKNGL